MNEQISAFIKDFSTLARIASEWQAPANGQLLRPIVTEYLGADPSSLAAVNEAFGPHRLADANNVIDRLLTHTTDVRLLGLAGQSRHHAELTSTAAGIVCLPEVTDRTSAPCGHQDFGAS